MDAQHRQSTSLTVLPPDHRSDKSQLVTNCEGCGVCCTEVPVPPFLDDIDFIPAELQREVIEAQKIEAELLAQRRPCIWHDPRTMKCIHHEHRPNICREFEIGGELCLEIRARFGINTSEVR